MSNPAAAVAYSVYNASHIPPNVPLTTPLGVPPFTAPPLSAPAATFASKDAEIQMLKARLYESDMNNQRLHEQVMVSSALLHRSAL